MLEGILAGELVLPAGDTVEPFIDADDIADVAVAALTEPRHRNKLFEVTGPRALTFAQCIQEMSEALGRPATDFKSYVQKTIESGVWDAERRELA